MASRIVIFATLFLLIINKAASQWEISGTCWPSVTTDLGRESPKQDVTSDGQISLYYRTEVADAVWIRLFMRDIPNNKDINKEINTALTKTTERGRTDISNTNNVIYVTPGDLQHSNQHYHNSILTGIKFRSNKKVEWTVCPLGVVPPDDTQNNQPRTNTHTTTTSTTTTTTSTTTTTPKQPTTTPNQPTTTPNQRKTPFSTDTIFDSTPNPKPQLGQDTIELIILSIVAVIMIPLIYLAYRGFCHYRRRYENAVKAKKELNRENGNRAIGNLKIGNSAIGGPEFDNPADHVYEEINFAGQDNYSTGQHAQHSGLQRYDSDNSLYGAVLQPH